MPKQTNKIGLTRSTVIQHINRKLSANNERLRVTRNDERMLREVGQFYITGEEGVRTAATSISKRWPAGWMSYGHGKQYSTTAEHAPHSTASLQ